ncbi:Gfo/Idh/MocA family oxidoreductase [Alphaproteobacteria bacterium]|nr:Gfo/Idh/MocA family oxidoreductase [Alphaproteobacteria bacterium]
MSVLKITNIALVGIGTIGKRHHMAIEQIENVNLAGIIDLSKHAKIYCDDKNIPLYKNLNDLKTDHSIDGVIISTPTILHYENAITALKLGFDVIIEKPISATVNEAKKINKVAKANNCKVLVGHQRRFYPLVLETKKIISEQKIGKIVGLSGVWGLRKDKDYFEPEWRKKVSAGPIITNLIHDIDYLRFIFGEIHSVSSFSSNMINNFEKEDVVSANMQFKSGLIGNFLITDVGTSPWSWETGIGENIHLPNYKVNNLKIIGTEGSLEFPNLRLWEYKNKNNSNNWKDEIVQTIINTPDVDPYISQIKHFMDVVDRKVEPVTGANDAEQTLKVALSILESANNGKTVVI